MSFEKQEKHEKHSSIDHSDQTRHNLVQQALKLYQCGGGGPIVSHPSDCHENKAVGALPRVSLSETQTAGKTERNGPEGRTSDGGKIVLRT